MNRLLVARTCLGLVEVLAPGVPGRVGGFRVDGRARQVVRVLGVRDMLQAAVTASKPSRAVLVSGAAVDGLHALSMVGLGLVDRRRRRAAGVSAAVAGLLAVAQVASVPRP